MRNRILHTLILLIICTTSVLAQNTAADCYKKGLELDKQKNYKEALKWFRKAAEQGLKEAQFSVGAYYYNGYGVSKNRKEAFKWHSKAAVQGLKESQYILGLMYYTGEEGVSKNYKEAFNWFSKAAAQGHIESQYWLGNLYYNGRGVSKNYEEAARWYSKAAAQGHIGSQYKLGNLYEKGYGVKQDDSKSVYWYKKAIDQGYVGDGIGCLVVGHHYAFGTAGLTKNLDEAIRYVEIGLNSVEKISSNINVRIEYEKSATASLILYRSLKEKELQQKKSDSQIVKEFFERFKQRSNSPQTNKNNGQ